MLTAIKKDWYWSTIIAIWSISIDYNWNLIKILIVDSNLIDWLLDFESDQNWWSKLAGLESELLTIRCRTPNRISLLVKSYFREKRYIGIEDIFCSAFVLLKWQHKRMGAGQQQPKMIIFSWVNFSTNNCYCCDCKSYSYCLVGQVNYKSFEESSSVESKKHLQTDLANPPFTVTRFPF